MSTPTNFTVEQRGDMSRFVAPIGVGTQDPGPVGFFGTTPAAQRTGTVLAAIATTAATSTSPFGFTSAQANAIIATLNEVRATLILYGLHTGAA